MVLRPVDESGDILPVLASSDLLDGADANAVLAEYRLNLSAGEWWENPSWGNAIVELLQETRFTEADQQTLASYISSYIRETPGVQDVRDVLFSVTGRVFRYSCTVDTEAGSASVSYSL